MVGRFAGSSLVCAALLFGAGPSFGDAGNLGIAPSDGFSTTGFAQGPFNQLEKVYTIRNNGTQPLIFSVLRNRFWISLSQFGGTLAAGESLDITVRINSRVLELPVTNDTANVIFFNQSAVVSDTRIVSVSATMPGPGTAIPESVVQLGRYAITLTGTDGSAYELQKAPSAAGPWSMLLSDTFSGATATHEILADQDMEFYRSQSSGAGAVPAELSMAKVESLDNSVVRVTGEVDGIYIVEASTNGMTWTPVYTNKIPESGSFLFLNAMADAGGSLQYRAVPSRGLKLPVLNHVLIAGESYAVGFDGAPALSTSSVGQNQRFTSVGGQQVLVPLRESNVETIASAAANQTLALAPLHPVVMSNVGQAGANYVNQMKGTAVYTNGMRQFADAPQALACALYGYAARAVFVLAGGGDFSNTNYAANVRQWQANYETDIRFLSGTTAPIPMFHSQFSAWSAAFYGGGRESAVSPYQVLAEAEVNPAKTVLVCPRYFLPHAVDGADFPGIHPSNEGYQWLGEYYGKVYKHVVVDGGNWSPLRPSSMTRSGAVINILFNTPRPPLVLDTTLVADPGHYGFEYTDDSENPPSIVGVSVTGATTVMLTLDAIPTGNNKRVRYAYTGIPGNPAGPTTGPRGNLRDSDPTISASGRTLYNWCVHFDKPVN